MVVMQARRSDRARGPRERSTVMVASRTTRCGNGWQIPTRKAMGVGALGVLARISE